MLKLLAYGSISLINTSLLCYIIISSKVIIPRIFLFLTIQNFIANTFYFLVMAIYELLMLNNSVNAHSHKFYKFMRNRFFKFVFILSCSVCSLYWLLYLGGEELMRQEYELLGYLLTIYLHFIVGVYAVLELHFTKRKYNPEHFIYDLMIVAAYNIMYQIIIVLLAKTTDIVLYDYLVQPIRMILFIAVITMLIVFNILLLFDKLMDLRGEVKKPLTTPIIYTDY
jgi:hypothetical protein